MGRLGYPCAAASVAYAAPTIATQATKARTNASTLMARLAHQVVDVVELHHLGHAFGRGGCIEPPVAADGQPARSPQVDHHLRHLDRGCETIDDRHVIDAAYAMACEEDREWHRAADQHIGTSALDHRARR